MDRAAFYILLHVHVYAVQYIMHHTYNIYSFICQYEYIDLFDIITLNTSICPYTSSLST